MDTLLRYWPMIGLVSNLLIGWVVWSMAQKFATKADIATLQKTVSGDVSALSNDVGDVSNRVSAIEKELEHIPNTNQLHETNIRLERVIGKLEAIERDYGHILGRQARLEDGLIRHDQILSDAARGKR